jgi:hypothetical protein
MNSELDVTELMTSELDVTEPVVIEFVVIGSEVSVVVYCIH